MFDQQHSPIGDGDTAIFNGVLSLDLVPHSLQLIGVGPGDPELLTIAAVRAIEVADVVAYPVARANANGMAWSIASRWIRSDQRRLPLLFPMIAEAEPRLQAWRHAADALASLARLGQAVVLLCEGDASLFATSSYVQLALRHRHPDVPFKVIPGISSVCAAAAACAEVAIDWPLALQQDGLLIRPCPDHETDLAHLLDLANESSMVLALIKLGQRWPWVRSCLERRQLLDCSLFAQRVGWPDQVLARAIDIPAETKPYFSMLLVRQTWPEVLP